MVAVCYFYCDAVSPRFFATGAPDMTAVLPKPDPPSPKKEAVVIKKYANRRLYNTETSAYVTLDDLAGMVRSDRDFVVFDAKTGDDLTHSVLTQIIVEQEGKVGGQTLLPVPFLRQLIRFYDDSIGKMVPSYLQMSLQTLVNEQERFRSQFAPFFAQSPFGSTAFEAMQEQTRKNMAMFEQAMKMWTPFSAALPLGATAPRKDEPAAAPGAPRPAASVSPVTTAQPAAPPTTIDIADLKAELAAMQQKIEKLSQTRE
jgi:polyhydroxyalkanoate synthesis repressor PhaR